MSYGSQLLQWLTPDSLSRTIGCYQFGELFFYLNLGLGAHENRRALESQRTAARAVNSMAMMGYTNVYLAVDSFEGDKVTYPDSHYVGRRMQNGWKNSGGPWGYDQDPEFVYRPRTE